MAFKRPQTFTSVVIPQFDQGVVGASEQLRPVHAEALDPFRVAFIFARLFATSYVPSECHAASATRVEIVASRIDNENTLLVHMILPVSHSVRDTTPHSAVRHIVRQIWNINQQKHTMAHIYGVIKPNEWTV